MKATKYIWKNGELVAWSDAMTHVLTHALHYGTAVFEGIRCYSTDRGPAIFRLEDHISRLLNSAKIYSMPLLYRADELRQAILDTVKANELEECYIRPIAYYGYGMMGVNPTPNRVDCAIAVWEWGGYLGDDAFEKGIRCMVSSWRRISPQALPPQAKASANYANLGLAKVEALRGGYDEAIMLNWNGMVAEGTGENIFRVKKGELSTPSASSGVLRGVTRDTITHLAADLHIPCRHLEISRDELYTSDELFLCGTAAEITPIREVDGRWIGNMEWPISRRIQDAYTRAVHGKNPDHAEWLTQVE